MVFVDHSPLVKAYQVSTAKQPDHKAGMRGNVCVLRWNYRKETTTMNEFTAEASGLSQVGQIAVPVSDIDRAVQFYRDVLGMRFLFQVPPGLGFFDLNGVRLMLDGPAKAQAGNSSVIYYKVPDLEAAFAALSQRGAQFEAGPHLVAKMSDHELWMAFFRDPDQNLLALMSEVRP
ncbi:MAG: Glyoxalase-like domain protein [Hydrocarboniphaga sp.]|uniref:VOC family protein n=1 Tax=Hydrocarboniphaga sp. TaxID=2033016 RepID=UPI00261CFA74|nr:VOC family protein [Hydrocarboniphaga sp.]MDB5969690.1 Glyoxalase-like domain protein [Hydrocarboniphaga sp.]